MLHPQLRAYFDEYLYYHQHETNRLTHKIAIPVIVFHILAMLDWMRIPFLPTFSFGGISHGLSVGHLFFVGTVIWYLTLSPKLAALMAIAFAPCFLISPFVPWWAVVAIAVVAWTVQLAGHAVWEKRKPAFLKNLLQALVGPLFFVALLTGDYTIEDGKTRLATA